MRKPTLRDKLVKYLFDCKDIWVAKGAIQRMQWRNENGTLYIGDTVGRALRDAEENCFIAVKHTGKNTQYKWIPFHLRPRYIPTSMRGDDTVLFRKNV